MTATPCFATPDEYVTTTGEHINPSEMPDLTKGADRPNAIFLHKLRSVFGIRSADPLETMKPDTEATDDEKQAAYKPLADEIQRMQNASLMEIFAINEKHRMGEIDDDALFSACRSELQSLTMKSLALTMQSTGVQA